MPIRVTVGSAQAGSLAGLQAASDRLAGLQQKLSTGQQISRPSDDPAGAVRALALRGDLKQNAQFARNQSDATAWLSVADTTYGQIGDLVQKVRTLTVQAANTGASTGASATAIADQIVALREAAMKLANTTYNGRPIFGGTTGSDVAFADDGAGNVVYRGDDGAVHRLIGNKNDVKISQTGTEAFGADGSNLFDLMDSIVAALKTTGEPPSSALGELDTAIGDLTSARAASGSALQRVEAAATTGATEKITIRTNLAEIQDIDLAEVAIEMNTAQVVYEASLQTTANIRQLSLMNFLK